MEIEISGTGLNRFCAIGRLHIYNKQGIGPRNAAFLSRKEAESDSALELSRLEIAIERTCEEYEASAKSAESEFALSILREERDSLADRARENIFRGHCAESAVMNAVSELSAERARDGDPYLSLGATMALEAGSRIAEHLAAENPNASGKALGQGYRTHALILAAKELSPSELLAIDSDMLLGLVLTDMSPLSETVITAHSLGIPLMVECEGVSAAALGEHEGETAVIDAEKGVLKLSPSEETIEEYAGRFAELALAGAPKKRIPEPTGLRIFASVSREKELEEGKIGEEASGIDLFTLRTFNKGEVKEDCLLSLKAALGLTKGRVSLLLPRKPSEQRNLLKMLMNYTDKERITVLCPDVICASQIRELRAMIDEISEREDMSSISLGAMIEAPAALLLARETAAACDNITVNIDRLLLSLMGHGTALPSARLLAESPELTEALRRLLALASEAASGENTPLCICGMLATRKKVIRHLRSLGIREISVPPAYLPYLK